MMYSPGIASPISRSSGDVGTVVLVDEVDVVEVEVEVDASVVLVGSCVSITDITESGSTMRTCASLFSRRTSAVSSSATKPFTLLANTSVTSFPSAVSFLTLAATLTESFRMTM